MMDCIYMECLINIGVFYDGRYLHGMPDKHGSFYDGQYLNTIPDKHGSFYDGWYLHEMPNKHEVL